MKLLFILAIRLWQRSGLSARSGFLCVHSPSCSEYAVLAIREHGVVRGVAMSFARMKLCSENLDAEQTIPR